MPCSLLKFKLDMAMTTYSKMNTPITGEVEDFVQNLRRCEPSLFTRPCCLRVRMNTNSNVGRFSAYCKALTDLNIYFRGIMVLLYHFFKACYESTSKSL
jgi:hypothetical protein